MRFRSVLQGCVAGGLMTVGLTVSGAGLVDLTGFQLGDELFNGDIKVFATIDLLGAEGDFALAPGFEIFELFASGTNPNAGQGFEFVDENFSVVGTSSQVGAGADTFEIVFQMSTTNFTLAGGLGLRTSSTFSCRSTWTVLVCRTRTCFRVSSFSHGRWTTLMSASNSRPSALQCSW